MGKGVGVKMLESKLPGKRRIDKKKGLKDQRTHYDLPFF
jgi:hypothetical protein